MAPNGCAGAVLQIDTLGGLSVRLRYATEASQSGYLHFEARTAYALLIYLACQARPIARETLAEFLWPERSHEQARTNLRLCLHRLHEQLGDYLLVTRQTIATDGESSIVVDSRAFEAHVRTGRLDAAVALYKGDFLEGFFLNGSPAFEQWALVERERLRLLAETTYEQLITQSANLGQLDLAIGFGERLLQLDPLHEPTQRQIMRLLVQTGRRNSALSRYATYRDRLETELGVAPEPTTAALYAQIRAGETGDAANL